MNTHQQQLWNQFFDSLSPEAQGDVRQYVAIYDMYLDESDPAKRKFLKEEMQRFEIKYNLSLNHTKKAAQ